MSRCVVGQKIVWQAKRVIVVVLPVERSAEMITKLNTKLNFPKLSTLLVNTETRASILLLQSTRIFRCRLQIGRIMDFRFYKFRVV